MRKSQADRKVLKLIKLWKKNSLSAQDFSFTAQKQTAAEQSILEVCERRKAVKLTKLWKKKTSRLEVLHLLRLITGNQTVNDLVQFAV